MTLDQASESQPQQPAATFARVFVERLWEALFSFRGVQLHVYLPKLRKTCARLGPDLCAVTPVAEGALSEITASIDGVKVESMMKLPRLQSVQIREAFLRQIAPPLRRLFEALDGEGALTDAATKRQVADSTWLLEKYVEKLEAETMAARYREQRKARPRPLKDQPAFFWLRPGKVRWALTTVANLVQLVAERRGADLDGEEIRERAGRLRAASRSFTPDPPVLMGLEIRNDGDVPVEYAPLEKMFKVWLCPQDDCRDDPSPDGRPVVDMNLTLSPVLFRDDDEPSSRYSMAPPPAALSDGEWDYSFGPTVVLPAKVFLGLVAVAAGEAGHAIRMAGLRDGDGYWGAQPSAYLRGI